MVLKEKPFNSRGEARVRLSIKGESGIKVVPGPMRAGEVKENPSAG
jgi:hypothetical protein